ncbi:MAG: hypothetical protein ABIC04_07925 [Nanoarchaeota archaeon]
MEDQIIKLADVFLKTGMAFSEHEAVEKAKATLNAEKIVIKSKEANDPLSKDITVEQLLQEAGKEENHEETKTEGNQPDGQPVPFDEEESPDSENGEEE